jgi:kinesin family member 18/19
VLSSENAAESMKELIRDKDTQIMELKNELEVLSSCRSCKNFSIIVRDTPLVQDDTMSSGEAAHSLVSKSNQPKFNDATTDNIHVSKIIKYCC